MSAEVENPYAVSTACGVVIPVIPIELPAKKPRVWTVALALVAAVAVSFGLQIAVGIGLVGYLLSTGTPPQGLQAEALRMITSPAVFTFMIVTGPGAFGLVALVAAWLSPQPLRERLGLVPVQCSRGVYPLATIGSIIPFAVGLGLAQALAWLAPWVPVDRSAMLLFEQMTIEWAVPFVVLIGLVPGFCEEMLFRGYMQQRLSARWGPAVAIIVASVLFGLAHVMPHVVIFATLLGLWFGFVAYKCGSIWPTIAGHFFINSGLNAWRMVVKFGEVPESAQQIVMVTFLLMGAICFVLALIVLLRVKRQKVDDGLQNANCKMQIEGSPF